MCEKYSAFAYVIKDTGEVKKKGKKLCIIDEEFYSDVVNDILWKESDSYKKSNKPVNPIVCTMYDETIEQHCKNPLRLVPIPRFISGETPHLVVFDENNEIIVKKIARCFHDYECECDPMIVYFTI